MEAAHVTWKLNTRRLHTCYVNRQHNRRQMRVAQRVLEREVVVEAVGGTEDKDGSWHKQLSYCD